MNHSVINNCVGPKTKDRSCANNLLYALITPHYARLRLSSPRMNQAWTWISSYQAQACAITPSSAEVLSWQKELRSVLFNRDEYETVDSLKPLFGGGLAFLNMDFSPPGLNRNDVFDELERF
mmetsp:Transcript_29499/g.54060  ORF Transcript_29499/g.54060 Transcript_29499/m.54060 type:complete len:122 (+) Transcript_29499:328-693(+)